MKTKYFAEKCIKFNKTSLPYGQTYAVEILHFPTTVQELTLTLLSSIKNCNRQYSNFFLKNKSWHLQWNVSLANRSQELSSLYILEWCLEDNLQEKSSLIFLIKKNQKHFRLVLYRLKKIIFLASISLIHCDNCTDSDGVRRHDFTVSIPMILSGDIQLSR